MCAYINILACVSSRLKIAKNIKHQLVVVMITLENDGDGCCTLAGNIYTDFKPVYLIKLSTFRFWIY